MASVPGDALLAGLYEKPGDYKLHFTFNGKEHTTIFKVNIMSDEIKITNNCVTIRFYKRENYKVASLLQKNHSKKHCFEPPLDVRGFGNENKKKHTMTDALQILSTKIKLAAPEELQQPIIIVDSASIGDIAFTPYRILRGEDGLYEKYGYGSEMLNEIKEYVKTKTWGDFLAMDDIREKVEYFQRSKRLRPKFEVPEDTPIVNVFKEITMEDEEKTSNNKYDTSLSYAFFYNLSRFLFGEGVEPLELELNRDGEKWQSMKDAVQILGLEPVSGGGGRRKTRKRKTRHSMKKK